MANGSAITASRPTKATKTLEVTVWKPAARQIIILSQERIVEHPVDPLPASRHELDARGHDVVCAPQRRAGGHAPARAGLARMPADGLRGARASALQPKLRRTSTRPRTITAMGSAHHHAQADVADEAAPERPAGQCRPEGSLLRQRLPIAMAALGPGRDRPLPWARRCHLSRAASAAPASTRAASSAHHEPPASRDRATGLSRVAPDAVLMIRGSPNVYPFQRRPAPPPGRAGRPGPSDHPRRRGGLPTRGMTTAPRRPPRSPPSTRGSPSQSDAYELVGVLRGDRLGLYLDRFASNEPVTDAKIAVTVGGDEEVQAEAAPDGTYTVASPKFAGEGPLELIFAVTAPGGDDLLIGTLQLPAKRSRRGSGPGAGLAASSPAEHPDRAASATSRWPTPYVIAGVALALGFLLGLVARSRRKLVPVAGLALVVLLVSTAYAFAHEGHDHGARQRRPPCQRATRPRRLPDGTVFVPKPSQRLLERAHHRHEAGGGAEGGEPDRPGHRRPEPLRPRPEHQRRPHHRARERPAAPRPGGQEGRRAGAGRAGRAPGGPHHDLRAGGRDRAGDRGRRDQAQARAPARRSAASRRRARSPTPRPSSRACAAAARSCARPGSSRRSCARPSTASSPRREVVAGQVVARPGRALPDRRPEGALGRGARLRRDRSRQGHRRQRAAAVDGTPLKLALPGLQPALQQQATRRAVRGREPAGDLVRRPAGDGRRPERRARSSGIILPRDAVVRGANGEAVVWRHTDPERFEARPVRTEPFDATRAGRSGPASPRASGS